MNHRKARTAGNCWELKKKETCHRGRPFRDRRASIFLLAAQREAKGRKSQPQPNKQYQHKAPLQQGHALAGEDRKQEGLREFAKVGECSSKQAQSTPNHNNRGRVKQIKSTEKPNTRSSEFPEPETIGENGDAAARLGGAAGAGGARSGL